MNKFLKYSLFTLLFILIMNCKTHHASLEKPFETLVYSQYGPEMEATKMMIENMQDFEKIYVKVYENRSPKPEIPTIDFDNKSVIFIHFGSFSYGGITYEVQKVSHENKELYIKLFHKQPKRGEPALTVMTNPVMLIEIPKINPTPTIINIETIEKD